MLVDVIELILRVKDLMYQVHYLVTTWYTIEQTKPTAKLVCTATCILISYYFNILDPNTVVSAPRAIMSRGLVSSDFNSI